MKPPAPRKPPAQLRGIPCRKCKRVEPGHNAANCGKTPVERALASRGVQR